MEDELDHLIQSLLDESPSFLDFENVFELKDGTPPPSLIPPPTMSPPKPHPQSAARFAIRADYKEAQAAQNNSIPQNTAHNTSLAVPPLRLERKGLGNVAYTTCTLWNADLVIRRSLLKSVIIFNFFNNKLLLNFMYDGCSMLWLRRRSELEVKR